MSDKIKNVLDNMDNVDNTKQQAESRKVVLKKDKGLIEHTRSSRIILTEDNKQLLTD